MSWQHLGRLGGNNIPASRNHGDVMRPPTQAELAAYVGWVGFINPAPSQSPVASPAEGTWRSWVDGANPAYGTFASRYRSEEHTSELQSLMRTSYAVFCLK